MAGYCVPPGKLALHPIRQDFVGTGRGWFVFNMKLNYWLHREGSPLPPMPLFLSLAVYRCTSLLGNGRIVPGNQWDPWAPGPAFGAPLPPRLAQNLPCLLTVLRASEIGWSLKGLDSFTDWGAALGWGCLFLRKLLGPAPPWTCPAGGPTCWYRLTQTLRLWTWPLLNPFLVQGSKAG